MQGITLGQELHALCGGMDPLAESIRCSHHLAGVVRIKSAEEGHKLRGAAVEALAPVVCDAWLVELDEQ